MREVRIYVDTNIKGPGHKDGTIGYVLETNTNKGPATMTAFKQLEQVTAHKAELVAVTEALGRLNTRCRVEIYTESEYIVTAFAERWIERWIALGWKTSKGKPVANAEEWKKLIRILGEHQYSFISGRDNEYKEWLQRELRRIL